VSVRFPYLAANPGQPGQFLRPFVPVAVIGSAASRYFPRALLDTGSEDTIFPAALASLIGVDLAARRGRKNVVRWRGANYSLLFGNVTLEISDGSATICWPADVGFSDAPLPYVLLGGNAFLEFFDTTFLGWAREIELSPNVSFPGTIEPPDDPR